MPDTDVLVTRFLTEAGVRELIDFMPVTGGHVTGDHRLVRLLRCVRGQMTFEVDVAPRFDYGRRTHELHVLGEGAVFRAGDMTLTLHAVRSPRTSRWRSNGPAMRATCI